ncbi:MAG TPA: protein kinase [Gemmatimonadaceae bacterium]|nr:protein kinase [Gemmatimonadaceae bacterium]
MSNLKICPVCSTEYPANERFCPRDGTALRAQGSPSDLVGAVIAERYHVLKKLGEGGMGQVYLAEHVKMGRKSAVKVMNPGMVQNVDAISRFNREAANASRINHPNVAGIYDFGETADGLIYLAMEFVEGEPLTNIIKQHGALPPMRASEIARQTAEGLSVAHEMGIVHRDLKPDNIMVGKGRNGADLVKVVDFGIAKAAASDEQKVTKTGMVVGTPEYMSPEQLSGDPLDARSDIYSLALVTFNMLTGTLPFPGESMQETMIMRLTDDPRRLGEMRPDVSWPADLQAVMDKALARDANKRYRNASEFARDLVEAIDRMPATSITKLGTQVLTPMTAAEAATAATIQVQVPATRVAAQEEIVGRTAEDLTDRALAPGTGTGVPRRPVAPAAHTPTRSRTPLFAGFGGLAAVVIALALIFKPWSSKPGPDSTNSPGPSAALSNAVDSPSVTTSGASTPAGATTPQLSQRISSAVDDTLGLLERRMSAIDISDSLKAAAAAQPILDKAIDLNADQPLAKVRRALLIYEANVLLGNQSAACLEMLGVRDFALTTKGIPSKTSVILDGCKP